jgi:Zn-dependent M28 family amino/carboxypeptidase
MRTAPVLLLVATAFAVVASPASADKPSDTKRLRDAVTVNGILKHEQALQRIADANGGTRASGTSGFDASRDYVASQLRSYGYRTSIQPFEFPFFQETAPPAFERTAPTPRVYQEDTDFATMDFSGSGDITGNVVPTNDIQIPPGPTPSSSNSGCQAADYPAETSGNIALVQRGTCTFGEKAAAAKAAGAIGVIVFNEGQEGRTEVVAGTLGGPVTIPVIGTSFDNGKELYDLANAGTTTVHITTHTFSENRTTYNVVGDTTKGDPNNTVVVGAHLDSVIDGPGINDDGSGTSTDLEIAKQLQRLPGHTKNRVRFLFFGAEEEGLLGSQAYVASQTPEQIAQMKWMLDFDMLASPNFVRFVYDGDGSSGGPAGPQGSGEIEAVFNEFWNSRGLATEPTPFDGRSDYDSFTAEGIPAGGIFAGAEGVKTPEQASVFGGTAGQPYDPCYHLACDTFANLNTTALDQFSDADAHALAVFAGLKGKDHGHGKKGKKPRRTRKLSAAQTGERLGHSTIR